MSEGAGERGSGAGRVAWRGLDGAACGSAVLVLVVPDPVPGVGCTPFSSPPPLTPCCPTLPAALPPAAPLPPGCSQLYIAVLNCIVGISRAAHLDVRAVCYQGIGNEWLDWLRELDAAEEREEEGAGGEGGEWCRK